MKLNEVNKLISDGTTILTGRFMGCKIAKTQKGTEYEVTTVSGASRNFEFRRFAPSGSPAGTLKPRYSLPFGQLVAVVGFACDVRDGYQQLDCTDIVPIEA